VALGVGSGTRALYLSSYNGPIIFATNARAERARIDASGNLGVGTTSPATKLHVKGSGELARLETTGATGSNYLNFRDASADKAYVGFTSGANETFVVQNIENGDMLFATNNTERARFHATGGMSIGVSTDDGLLTTKMRSSPDINISLRDSANLRKAFFIADGYYGYQWAQTIYSNGGKAFIFANASETEAGNIVVNASSVDYNTSSDYRLKDNPQPLTGSGEFIDAIQPKTWTWKNTGEKGVGMIAHELAEVAPLSVSGEKDAMKIDRVQDENGEYVEKEVPAYQSVAYGSAELIANMIAELQSLRKRVAELEAK
jgi:hypothetical protein